MGAFLSAPTPATCPSNRPVAPCDLAALVKEYAPASTYCASSFPVTPVTSTVTAPASTFTTVIDTTTVTNTIATSSLFLTTVEFSTFTNTNGAILQPVTVFLPVTRVVDVTPTVSVTVTIAVPDTNVQVPSAVITVRNAAASSPDDTPATALPNTGVPLAPRSVLLPGRNQICRNGVFLSGCGQRTCKYRCGVDRPFGDYRSFQCSTFDACSKACAEDTGCKVGAWDRATGICWLKDQVKTTFSNWKIDLIECDVQPSAVLASIRASDSAFQEAACSCLQTRSTATVTVVPSSAVSVTATSILNTTAIVTSLTTRTRATTVTNFRTATVTNFRTTEVLVTQTASPVTVTVFALATGVPPAVQALNFRNGGFEPEKPMPWSIQGGGFSNAGSDARSGQGSVILDTDHTRESTLSQRVGGIDPARRYTLSFYWKPFSIGVYGGANCNIRAYLGGYEAMNHLVSATVLKEGPFFWLNVNRVLSVPASTRTNDGELLFKWSCGAPPVGGNLDTLASIVLDDVSLTQA